MHRLGKEPFGGIPPFGFGQVGQQFKQLVNQKPAFETLPLIPAQRRLHRGLFFKRAAGCQRFWREGFGRRDVANQNARGQIGGAGRGSDLVCPRRFALIGFPYPTVARPAGPRKFRKIECFGTRIALHRLLTQIVPAMIGCLALALPAADIKPVFGARQRHIQQAVIFLIALHRDAITQTRNHIGFQCHTWQPIHQVAIFLPEQVGRLCWYLHGIGQEYDGRLQALGPMHRHDPDLVTAALFKVTLDFGVACHQPVQKPLQGRRMIGFVAHGKVKEFVNRVVCFDPEPPDQTCAHPARIITAPTQKFGKQFERTFVIHTSQPFEQEFIGRKEGRIGIITACLFAQGKPKGARTVMGNRKQLIIVKPDQRAFEDLGQCQVVFGHQKKPAKGDQVHHGKLIGDLHTVHTGNRNVAFL